MAEKTIQQLSAQADVQDGDLLVIQRGGSPLAKITAKVLGSYLAGLLTGVLKAANNLSDLGNVATARGNLGLQGLAVQPDVPTALGYAPVSKLGDTVSGPIILSFSAPQGANGSGNYDAGQMLELFNASLGLPEQRTITAGTSPGGNGYIRAPHQGLDLVAGSELVASFTPAGINLTFTPQFPTRPAGDSSTYGATTGFVTTAIGALIGGAPGALDTLKELADAINDDTNFAGTVTAALQARLVATNNLSDLTNVSNARTNLGLGSAATQPASAFQVAGSYVVPANNLSDLANVGIARTNLGLGSAATHNAGDFQAAGSYLTPANNLSDVADAGIARGNLGLGSAATHNAGDFQAAGSYQSTVLYGTGAPPALAAGQIYIQVAAV